MTSGHVRGRNLIAALALATIVATACTDTGDDDSSGATTLAPISTTASSISTSSLPTSNPPVQSKAPEVPESVPPATPGADFRETFSGAPGAPTSWDPINWDVVVHSRDTETRYALESIAAMHGTDCAGPPSTHQISAYEDAVFQCRDHLMTAIGAGGYGLIYLTPNQLVDMSDGEAVVSWDMSTARTSLRDWVDVWITPFSQNMILPFEGSDPDLQGPPQNALHVRMDQFDGKAIFKLTIYKDFQEVDVPEQQWWMSYEEVLKPDAARRDTFELRVSNGHVKFGMPKYDIWWADTAIADLGFTSGVVQFGHHSYNPMKDCDACTPNTWHWDNVTIAPAVPFTITGGDRRLVDSSTGVNTVSFSAPSPAGSYLRFSGQGDAIEISVDDGATWTPALLQKHGAEIRTDHAASYWTPIPAGITSVRFRGDDDFVVRDASIFSLTI